MPVKTPKERIIKLRELIHLFHENIRQYKTLAYDEANTRVDFIDKFFELLEWDVRNTQGYSEAYREVVREDKVVIAGKPKAPDYSFRIGGRKFFFVEAKKPCVNIKEERDPAFQLRRYGYTAKLPLSILTDFEEFAVYDTRIKPSILDKASTARIFYCEFIDLLKQNSIDPEITNFEYIYSIFSKDAILKGSFDRYIEETKNKKGTSEVDKEILKLIDDWRCELAKNIALRNTELDVYNLNYAVQKIIDRIIFLRIAEDRYTEEYGKLQSLLNKKEIYKQLVQLFDKANTKYNSGLFTRQQYIDELQIDNNTLTRIINSFYYPACPYEFSILPIEILGNAYEQFLGRKIRLTASHQAKIEEKPEVRKAGGVYYTPQYIVDYIVQNTIGEKVKRKKPEDIEHLRIVDPACGSGSFLVRAYDFLLKYHIKYYCQKSKLQTALKKGKIYQVDETTYYLSIDEKQKILLNNIYGVDIDEQAVEVTKLSLLLKLMENEGAEYKNFLFQHHDLTLLPDLSDNIKCGNSLIGSDFYNDKDLGLFDKDEMRKVNVFDWEKEFPEVFENGGFDCVIGNPPYVLGRETFNDKIKKYFTDIYFSYKGKYDLYIYFCEKSISLLRKKGKLGFIIPNTILVNENASNIRKIILNQTNIEKIILYKEKIFQKAHVENVIIILERILQKEENKILIMIGNNQFKIDQNLFYTSKDFRFNINANDKVYSVFTKIKHISINLGDISDICIGIQLGGSSRNKVKESFISNIKKDESYKKVLDGKEINRYIINWAGNYVHYGDWLHRKRDTKYFCNLKIIMRQIGKYPIATLDIENFYTLNTIYNLISNSEYSLKYLLAIINSRIGKWFWENFNSDFKILFPKIKKSQIENIPIKTIDFNNQSEKRNYDTLVTLIDLMLENQKQYYIARTEGDKTIQKKKIDLLDKQIDSLVYELYGLTDEEIKIVEEF